MRYLRCQQWRARAEIIRAFVVVLLQHAETGLSPKTFKMANKFITLHPKLKDLQ